MNEKAKLEVVKGGVEEQQPSIQIIISMFPNGQINVNGPIHDKILCYGLLEIARDIVKDYKPQQVIVPQIVLPPNLRGGQG